MLTGWSSFKGWACLEYFLRNPTEKIHVREFARRLKISPLTANTYLKNYQADGILESQAQGNAVFYRLKETPLTLGLKKTYVLSVLEKTGFVHAVVEENPAVTSIILYGTRASGAYDEKSDYDFLVFSKDPKYPKKATALLDAPATITVLDVLRWRKMNPSFKSSVYKNHVVLFGAGLVMS